MRLVSWDPSLNNTRKNNKTNKPNRLVINQIHEQNKYPRFLQNISRMIRIFFPCQIQKPRPSLRKHKRKKVLHDVHQMKNHLDSFKSSHYLAFHLISSFENRCVQSWVYFSLAKIFHLKCDSQYLQQRHLRFRSSCSNLRRSVCS